MNTIHLAMKKTACLLSLLICCTGIRAQNVDSLRAAAMNIHAPDSMRALAMGDLVRAYSGSGQEDSAFARAHQLISFCDAHGLTFRAALARRMLGVLHSQAGRYDSAGYHLEQARDGLRATGNKAMEGETELSIGLNHHLQGLFPQALQHNLRALALVETTTDSAALAHCHVNIAALYTDMQRIPEAIAHVEKALAIMRATGDPRIRNALAQLGMLHGRQGEYGPAMRYLEEALARSEQAGDPLSASRILQSMGNVQHGQGLHAQAIASFERSSSLTTSSYTLIQNDINIGIVLTEMGRPDKAIPLLEKAVAMAHADNDLPDESQAYQELASAYERLGDKARAYTAYRRHIALRDSITNEDKTRELTRIEMRYDFDKQQLADSLRHEGEKAVQAQEIRRQKLARNGFMGGFALVALFAGVFFFQRNRISKEKQRSEELLLNILPEEVAEELKAKGEADAVQIDQVTVLFTDFKGFTALSETLSPKELVRDLNECFSAFDKITTKYGIEKIKTIGDAYMAAGGLPTPNTTHAVDVINAALEMRDFIAEGKARKIAAGLPYFEIRIGIHTGPVVAGIVGVKKFQYDIWGDTVNTASRMESSGEVGQVNISEATYRLVKEVRKVNSEWELVNGTEGQQAPGITHSPFTNSHSPAFVFTPRGKVQAKGKGELEMYFVERS